MDMVGSEMMGSFQHEEVLQMIQDQPFKAQLQSQIHLISKAVLLEQNKLFSTLLKKSKDEFIKQILSTEIKLNERIKDVRIDPDHKLNSYEVISFDPISPKPRIQPEYFYEPGGIFDSQKILEDLCRYQMVKHIEEEVAIMPKREEKMIELNKQMEVAVEEEKLRDEALKHQ